jgi:hypothetical protein
MNKTLILALRFLYDVLYDEWMRLADEEEGNNQDEYCM